MELLRAGKQERALICLKLKKLRTQRLDELDAQLLNLYQMVRWPLPILCTNFVPMAPARGDGVGAGARAAPAAARRLAAGLTAPPCPPRRRSRP